MRQRIKLKPERVRLKVKPERVRLKTWSKATYNTRPKEYYNLRMYWLHELRQLRAQRRIAGKNVKKDVKAAQRALLKLYREYC